MMMPEAPGPMMRRLRRERNLTLHDAANALDISSSALSRAEREQRSVKRQDIEAAISGYALSHWEAVHLLASAGLAPPHPPTRDEHFEWTTVTGMLRDVILPAFVVDEFDYLLAWNGEQVALWQMTDGPVAPMHILDVLFSARVRTELGDGWMETVISACWQYYLKTLPLAGDARYRRTMTMLADKHGAEFIAIWNQAVATGLAAGWSRWARANSVVVLHTSAGVIEYLVLQNVTHATLPVELYVHVPLGAQSIERHARLMTSVKQGRIVRCPRPLARWPLPDAREIS